MLYIVTTLHEPNRLASRRHWRETSRRAVATLEEAREYVVSLTEHLSSVDIAHQTLAFPESGGTVGPLPDGTVIEVERVAAGVLARDAGLSFGLALHHDEAEIIDAYNAREAS